MALGILCLETYWDHEITDRRTVHGLLQLLEDNEPAVAADHAHVATKEDIRAYLQGAWPVDSYDVLYVATHGNTGGIVDEDEFEISLGRLAGMLEGRCAGRVVFLAGCSTLDVPERRVKAFLERTKAAALVGYTKDVDWLEGAQMDLIVLGALSRGGPDAMGAWQEEPKQILETVRERHEVFADHIGWDYWPSNRALPARRRKVPDGARETAEQLIEIAHDERLEPGMRVDAVRTAARLGASPGEVASVAKDRAAPIKVRSAAITALRGISGAPAKSVLVNLRKRVAADERDPGRVRLRRALGQR
ncbi:MAG: DUF6642 family protein [Solirubrobacterales bacterium]